MYDVKKFTATPGLARRLLAFSQIHGLDFDQKLADLAFRDLLSPKDLQDFAFQLNSRQLESLQFIRDWQGRGMILCDRPEQGRHISLANAWLSGGRTVIMAQPKFYHVWAQMIRDAFPDSKISVFGNPRYMEKSANFPQGVEFSERPDLEADFFVTSYGGLIWHDLFNTVDIEQTIVEELSYPGAVNYKWGSGVNGLFYEVPKPIFIQDINDLPTDPGKDILASIQTNKSKALQFIGETITTYMWPGVKHLDAIANNYDIKECEDYLASIGYAGVDRLKILSLFGISSHLLESTSGARTPITFYDATIKSLVSVKKKDNSASGLYRIFKRERLIEEETGLTVSNIVQRALNGDRPSMTLIGGLKTPQWASLKVQHLKSVHTQLANRLTKCLFLTESQDVRRSLMLSMGNQLEILSSDDRERILTRYLDPIIFRSLPVDWWDKIRTPISNLVVTVEDLINEPDLLKASNFLFMVDPPMSQEYWDSIKEATSVTGTRIVNGIILSTFEEEIYKNLR
jgi:hypothetical protein